MRLDELKRDLSFRDVFFLSFGGMSPLLSLLTYGAVALAYGGLLSPIVIIPLIMTSFLPLETSFIILGTTKAAPIT